MGCSFSIFVKHVYQSREWLILVCLEDYCPRTTVDRASGSTTSWDSPAVGEARTDETVKGRGGGVPVWVRPFVSLSYHRENRDDCVLRPSWRRNSLYPYDPRPHPPRQNSWTRHLCWAYLCEHRLSSWDWLGPRENLSGNLKVRESERR